MLVQALSVTLGCFISNCPESGKKRSFEQEMQVVAGEQKQPYEAMDDDFTCPSNPTGLCVYPGVCCVAGSGDDRCFVGERIVVFLGGCYRDGGCSPGVDMHLRALKKRDLRFLYGMSPAQETWFGKTGKWNASQKLMED